MTQLAGKVAVITGAGRGLGRHVACGLAARGASAVLIARNSDQLAETAAAIRDQGGQSLSIRADIGKPEEVDVLKARVLAEFKTVDILINAAGVFGPIQPIGESDVARWLETMQTNLIGPYLTCRAFVDGMVERGWGRIINFSSAAAFHTPGPLNSAYATSKVALNHFTRHLAAEIVGKGVTANVIHPGEAKTAMWAAIREESAQAGSIGEAFRQWAAAVGESGGDPPEKALELVLDLIEGEHANTSGKFLWIKNGQQTPIPSW
jgi:NAD(P)-dependent dehydrogenase (short-subunit alcohol dehydrogenase family)